MLVKQEQVRVVSGVGPVGRSVLVPVTAAGCHVTVVCRGRRGVRCRLLSVCGGCRGIRLVPAGLLQVLASQRSVRDPDLPALPQPVPLRLPVQSTSPLTVVLSVQVLCPDRKETLGQLEV